MENLDQKQHLINVSPFLDENKRAVHLAIDIFLSLNSYLLDADEAFVTKIILEVAIGNVNIDRLEC
ncbi:6070_t:CDS:2 [Funneliformis caledonium]|uniref:6070_t:CDS:1 n=1 Tax=Funneliformis caledonium TaxID=1117310 RepID=A0A9N9AI85_9GLOM|nr:6070_t:CDS:2 [Funneliformis caledonium]